MTADEIKRGAFRFIALAKDGAVVAEFVGRRKGSGYIELTGLTGPFPCERKHSRMSGPAQSWKMEMKDLDLAEGVRVFRFGSKAYQQHLVRAMQAASNAIVEKTAAQTSSEK